MMILAHALEALELDCFGLELRHRLGDVSHRPAQDGVRSGGHVLDDGHAQDRAVSIEHERNGALLDQGQPEDIAIEGQCERRPSRGNEGNEVELGERHGSRPPGTGGPGRAERYDPGVSLLNASILGLGNAPSSFGQTLALLITFLGIGVIANILIVYVVGQVLGERKQNQERQQNLRDGG